MKLDPKYGSFLTPLLKLVDATTGPILELGVGIWSTPMLDLMCRQTNRLLLSVESDSKWLHEIMEDLNDNSFHAFQFVFDGDWPRAMEVKMDEGERWSIVLIDHRPAKERRDSAILLKDKANFILLHDSEPEIDRFYRYTSIYKHFKYVYRYTKCLPNTTIVSNFIDPASILDIK